MIQTTAICSGVEAPCWFDPGDVGLIEPFTLDGVRVMTRITFKSGAVIDVTGKPADVAKMVLDRASGAKVEGAKEVFARFERRYPVDRICEWEEFKAEVLAKIGGAQR